MTTITVKQPRRLCSSRQAEQSFPLRAMGEQPRASVPPSSGCETPLLVDDCRDIYIYIYLYISPSGKRLHNYGKSPFLKSKSTTLW